MTYANLTDAEVRARIAELMGWKLLGQKPPFLAVPPDLKLPDDVILVPDGWRDEVIFFRDTSNWLGNIADAWAMEESIPEDRRERYAEILAGIVDDTVFFYDAEVEFDPGEGMTPREFAFALSHATPRQKCEAWLMMMEAAS